MCQLKLFRATHVAPHNCVSAEYRAGVLTPKGLITAYRYGIVGENGTKLRYAPYKMIMNPSRVLCFALVSLLILTLALAAGPSQSDLQSRIREFLDLYSKKDVAGVMNLVSDDSILVMGSDLSEVCTRREQVEELLRNDFQLWDSATFGKPVQVYTRQSGSLLTALFDVPFTLRRGGNQQTVVIRFATVWEKTKQGLKLVQSMNTTPTVGQSAKDLLAPK